MRLRTGSPRSPRGIGGVVWPTLLVILLLFNFLFLVNLMFFSTEDDNRKTSTTTSSTSNFHTVVNQHETSVLSQCEEEAFDLRNERHKNHQSPFQEKICEALPLGATAASLWNKHADTIHRASLHPLDTNKVHEPWTKDLQQLLAPFLLQRGLRQEPSHESLQKILKIIQRKLQNPTTAPPLQVAVVGGSVTEGSGCDKIPASVTVKPGERPVIRGGQCAWPNRLQLLLDQILGEGVIRIHNLSVGGTNTNLAIPVLDYWLFPANSVLLQHGPDVIINAYAANDNLPPASANSNMTGDYGFFYNAGLKRAQAFIRTSLESRPCQNDPLVLFVDEYLGNQHNLILGEMFRFESVDLLTSWYNNAGAISSAQVVRRLVFGNTEEDLFTAHWWQKRKPTEKKVDVHFGMPGHVHIAWTVAYSLLEMVLNFCEEETSRGGDHEALHAATSMNSAQQKHHEQHHDVASKFVPPEALELVEREIPPALSATLQVQEVAKQWHDSAVERNKSLAEYCGDSSNATETVLPCSLAFVAAPMGTVNDPRGLNNYLAPFIVPGTSDGWSGQKDISNGWQHKIGYVAGKANATVSFQIKETPNKVKTITLQTLKSYGEKWAGSQARFTLKWDHKKSGKSYSTSWDILGYHNQNTSIAYPFKLDLGPDHIAEKGSTLDLKIDLIGGTTFKINAMMICSR